MLRRIPVRWRVLAVLFVVSFINYLLRNVPSVAVDSILELPASEPVDLTTMFTADPALAARFTVTRTVEDDAARDVRYVKIEVVWESSDGQSHTRYFRTMYSKNGLYDYYYTSAVGA